jgi:hypothetical protein
MNFYQADFSEETLWRAIVLFGSNTTSYKFALGRVLLEAVSRGDSFIRIEDLASRFAHHMCQHVKEMPRQGTNPTNQFLDACVAFSKGDLPESDLVTATMHRQKGGLRYVIDRFHTVNKGEVPTRFYVDDRQSKNGLTLTDELLGLVDSKHVGSLPHEVEARWRLVETAWSLDIAPRLLEISYSDVDEALVYTDAHRRIEITSSRDALNGYQKGSCFYCGSVISVESHSPHLCDVDHFFPHTLNQYQEFGKINIDGAWNLVLACRDCNRGVDGKSALVPIPQLLNGLHQRNEYYIGSHHPLRETIINQTGKNEGARASYLQEVHTMALKRLVHTWPSTPKSIRSS